jgi:uncharacterized protein (DUF3084 family)
MKAVIGSWDTRPYKLLAEVTALRSRVAQLTEQREQLEAQLRALRAENAELREAVRMHDVEVVLSGS